MKEEPFIIPPMPKFVECPKCGEQWVWRTWYKGNKKTTCSKCKIRVTPKILPIPKERQLRLIKCGYCKRYRWYTGKERLTTCTKCKKKNTTVRTVHPEKFSDILKELEGDENWELYRQTLYEYGLYLREE